MFEILFGWRKASTCKKLIRRVQCRLKLLKNKRDSIVRQFKEDVIHLIKNGHQDLALSRIEQLYKDQGSKTLYDLLDSFCEFIIINISYIRRHRDCPNDINEAVSSLLYASARCGDLPELIKLRKLFSERYGQKFAITAVELLHGNLVNPKVIENLCTKSTPDDFKVNLLKEIAIENGLKLDYPGINDELELQQDQTSPHSERNYVVEWMEHDSERGIQFIFDDIDESRSEASYEKELKEIATTNNSASKCIKMEERPQTRSCLDMKNNLIKATAAAQSVFATVHTTSSNKVGDFAVKNKSNDEFDHFYEDEMGLRRSRLSNPGGCSSSTISGISPRHKVEKLTAATSESPSRCSERSIVYLDDVEELQPIIKDDVKIKDQRLFMFKSEIQSERKNHGPTTMSLSGIHQDCVKPQGQSVRTTSSRNASKKRSSRKRLKRRYVSMEKLSIKDVECALYYGQPDYSSADDDLSTRIAYPQRKHQRMIDEENLGSSFTNYREKISSPKSLYVYARRMPEGMRYKGTRKHSISHQCISKETKCGDSNFMFDKDADCCLECPCYTLNGADKKGWENFYQTERTRTKTSKMLHQSNLQEEKGELLLSSSEEAFDANVETKSKCFTPRRNMVASRVEEAEVIDSRPSGASSHDSCSRVASPWKHTRPPYLRALTMPSERPKVSPSNHPLRSSSDLPKQQNYSNVGSPSYIHPKLPDYDDLAAKFKALKKS